MKVIIVILLLFIIYNLGVAMFYMIKDKGQGRNTVRFLTVRIGASVFLFLLVLLALKMGWIHAHSLLPS